MGLGAARRRDEGRNYRPALLLLHGSGNTPARQGWTCPSPPQAQQMASPVSQGLILPARCSGSPSFPHGPEAAPSQEAPSYGWTQQDGPRHGVRRPHPGQDAGRDGNCVTLALARSCPVGGRERGEPGRVAPHHFIGAMLIYTGPGCNADRHGSSGCVGLGGNQRGGLRGAQRGGPALSPTPGASSRRVSAARLLPGSQQDLPDAPNLAHIPSLFALILPKAAPGRGRRHISVVTRDTRLSPGLPALLRLSLCASAQPGALPSPPCPRRSLRCATSQGHPISGPGTVLGLQGAEHQGGFPPELLTGDLWLMPFLILGH